MTIGESKACHLHFFSHNIHHFIFSLGVIANIILCLSFGSISVHCSSWFFSKRWNQLLSCWTMFLTPAQVGREIHCAPSKDHQSGTDESGHQKRGSRESRQEGKFQLWQWREWEKHKKLHKQWGHCLFQPISLASNHAATYQHDSLSGTQAKYFITNKDEWSS